jgi:DNA-binding NtrC family response regulator
MSYRVEVSYCGEAAIVKNNIGKYPYAIIDYSLPDMKGDELAAGLRVATPKIGLVLLKGFKNAISPDSLSLFNCVFEKPANLEQLEDAVDRLIEHSKQHEHKQDTQISKYLVNQAQVTKHFARD